MSKNSKAMEDKILKIGTHLKEGTITEAEAKRALLVLLGVSQQRELLIGLLTRLEKDGGNEWIDKEYIVNKYLANL